MKLTLRELFLLVALVAMGCGWTTQHYRWLRSYGDIRLDRDQSKRQMEMLLRNLGEQGMHVSFSGGRNGSNLGMRIRYEATEEEMTEKQKRRLLESLIHDQGYAVQWTDDFLVLTKGEDKVKVSTKPLPTKRFEPR